MRDEANALDDYSAMAATRMPTATPATSFTPMLKLVAAPSNELGDAEGEPFVTDAVPLPTAAVVLMPAEGAGVVVGTAATDVTMLVAVVSAEVLSLEDSEAGAFSVCVSETDGEEYEAEELM